MDRHYGSNVSATVPDEPAAANLGYPRPGNPQTATQPTRPSYWWYHMITEELRAIIIAAGLVPAFNVLTQLRDALYALFGRLAVANVWTKGQSGTVPALPATTGTLSFDFTAASNFSGQVTGNVTFGNGYTGPGAGKATWFSIRLQQDAATLRNWAFASNWKHVGGSAAIPSQTQTLGAWDEIVGQVLTDGTISFAVRSDVK